MLRRTRPRALLPGHAASRALRARQWLTRTFAGRALLIGAAIKLATGVAGTRGRPLPAFLEALDLAGGVILLIGVGIVISRLFVAAKRRLLWRVRRKLTLSYIFIGVVPALLIITFFVLCGLLLFFNVSSYLMQSRIRGLVDQAQFLAQTAALELQRAGSSAAIEDIIQRRQAGAATRSPDVSYSVVPVHRSCVASSTSGHGPRSVAPLAVGPWRHLEPPRTLPDWVPCSGYASLIAYDETMPDGSRGPTRVALRAVAVPDVESPAYAVIVDVPVASPVQHQLRDDTGIELGDIAALNTSDAALRPLEGRPIEQTEGPDAPAPGSGQERRGRLQPRLPYVAFLDYHDWK